MFQELFQSPDRPFRATPDTKFYFASESIEAARQTIVRAMIRAEGPVMVLGGAGLGKSILGEVVAGDLCQRLDVVKLHATSLCSRRALLQSILFELQLPYRDLSEGELRLSILDRLEPSPETAPEGVLIIVDEAHTLPSKLLDELRLISNFTRNNQPRTRLVLIGNLRLEDRFTEPQLDSFNQRLAARCYLQPLTRQETSQFVRHQLAIAGVEPSSVITEDGLAAVFAASEGVPRLVNQIMDHALVLATANHQCPISSPLIEEAWADLQQLPAPWHASSAAAGDERQSVVEFGSLEDDDDALMDAGPRGSQPAAQDTGLNHTPIETDELVAVPMSPAAPVTTPLVDEAESDPADSEPPQSTAAKAPNFFAAFEVDSLEVDADETDADALSSPVAHADLGAASESDQPTPLDPPPGFSFDASVAFAQPDKTTTTASTTAEPQPAEDQLPGGGFFASRPTDEELLALEDEQAQYDAMGVWENDPPLSEFSIVSVDTTSASELDEEFNAGEPAPEPPPRAAASDVTAEQVVAPVDGATDQNIFGADFEEEIAIPLDGTPQPKQLVSGSRGTKSAATTSSGPSGEDVRDYVARIQAYADAIQQSRADAPTVEQVLAEASLVAGATGAAEGMDNWEVNTAICDEQCEQRIADEIEDIVSQLNFSAFSVEPFSVEQISLDAPALPPTSQSRGDRRQDDHVEGIYRLHEGPRTSEPSLFNESYADYDDDRDMLVIEEELPVSAKLADQTQPQKPPVRTSPYNQLFAKLRK